MHFGAAIGLEVSMLLGENPSHTAMIGVIETNILKELGNKRCLSEYKLQLECLCQHRYLGSKIFRVLWAPIHLSLT